MKKYINLGKKLFPICRSITGKGTYETLKIIKKEIPILIIKKKKSGTKIFDWTIPPEWNIKEAYVKDKNNIKIIDFKRNNLHLVNYSSPVNININKLKLIRKIHTLKNKINAIPYLTSYYKRYWGFCLKYNDLKRIKIKYKNTDKFKVYINSSFNKNGFMRYGEVLLKGESKKEILLSTYICHPSMANNELSGPLVTMALINYFKKIKLKKTIRVLFIPETIGSINYIKDNMEVLKKNVIAGLVITCVGDNNNFSYLPTKYGNTTLDKIILSTFKNNKLKYKKYSFLNRGSDERQYNSPHVELPVASVMRSKYGTYPEYHTSLDNFNLVNSKGLRTSFIFLKKIINQILDLDEKNFIKQLRKIKKSNPISKIICEPFMSKRNLYPSLSNGFVKSHIRNIMNFLQYADGSNNCREISKYIKLNLNSTMKIYRILKQYKLV
jgi:aminopeptidase-like protein